MSGNFKIITLVIFVAAALIGVLVFSGAIPLGGSGSQNEPTGTVVVWGTTSGSIVRPLLDDFNRVNDTFVVKYEEKSPDTFDQDLLEALASQEGPDMFFITDDLVFKYSNKIFTVPYASFPENTFKNNFVTAGEVFLTQAGVVAFPLTVDPLVMYYNRSMLDDIGMASPPAYWDELVNATALLTEKDDRGFITQSAVAFGQYANVLHAKEILSALFMQAGNSIVKESAQGRFSSALDDRSRFNPASLLTFYTNFADPLNSLYSWNRSFSKSLDAFSAEKTAFYFGYASEKPILIKKNPNQNFFVAPIPQIRENQFKITSAHTTGIAISKTSKNFNTAFVAAGLLSKGDFASKLAQALSVVPARRDLISKAPEDSFSPVFYSSGFFARSWVDPSPEGTDDIFRGMIDRVLSGQMTPEQAIRDGSAKLNILFTR